MLLLLLLFVVVVVLISLMIPVSKLFQDWSNDGIILEYNEARSSSVLEYRFVPTGGAVAGVRILGWFDALSAVVVLMVLLFVVSSKLMLVS